MRKLPKFCRNGHEFTPETIIVLKDGRRTCKICDVVRKRKYQQKIRETMERQVEVVCPECNQSRFVVFTTAKRLAKMPRSCVSCSRKMVRGRMSFQPQICVKCCTMFQGRSGAAKYCDKCAGRGPKEPGTCPVCKKLFFGQKGKKACSQSCRRRIIQNRVYFGGKLFEADGWDTKECRVCGKDAKEHYHVHHVFGNKDHSKLVVLCPGCHNAISQIAARKNLTASMVMKIAEFVLAQKGSGG